MCSAKDSSLSKITPKSLTEVEKTKVGNSCVGETRSRGRPYLRLFHIVVDRLQQVTECGNKNIEVIILTIRTRKNRQPA